MLKEKLTQRTRRESKEKQSIDQMPVPLSARLGTIHTAKLADRDKSRGKDTPAKNFPLNEDNKT
jgi:hypothetical protein